MAARFYEPDRLITGGHRPPLHAPTLYHPVDKHDKDKLTNFSVVIMKVNGTFLVFPVTYPKKEEREKGGERGKKEEKGLREGGRESREGRKAGGKEGGE